MTETYKVRGAMLMLPAFTAEELSQQSGVKISTVRTILARSSEFVEEVGRIASGKRGGQETRLRVRPSKAEELQRELEALFSDLRSAAPASSSAVPPQPLAPPLAMLTLDDTMRALQEAVGDKRDYLLKFARADAAAVRQELMALEINAAVRAAVQPLKLQLEVHEARLATECVRGAVKGASSTKKMVSSLAEKLTHIWQALSATPEYYSMPLEAASEAPFVVLIDGVCDEWTHRMKLSLGPNEHIRAGAKTYAASLRRVGATRLANEHGRVCVVAINSAKPGSEGWTLAREVLEHWRSKVNLYFLDEHYDPDLRNFLLGNRCTYYGDAITINERVLKESVYYRPCPHEKDRLADPGVKTTV